MHVHRLTISLVVAILLAAGCGDSATSTATTPTTSASAAQGAATTTAAPDQSATTVTTDGSPAPELTATDTGVTADSIKIATLVPDLSVIGRESGDVEAKFQSAIDAVNEAGGVNGRRIEMVYSSPSPLGDSGYDESCVHNVEDEKVFAVVGVLLRDTALCYTAVNDTIAITSFEVTSDLFDQSTAPLISVRAIPDRLVEVNVDALMAAGLLTPGMKVAVHGLATKEALQKAYTSALESRGIDVVGGTLRTVMNDITAGQSELGVLGARLVADNPDAVLATAPEAAGDLLFIYEREGLDLPMLLPEGSGVTPALIQETFGYDLDLFRFATTLVGDPGFNALYDHGLARVPECVDRFEQSSDEVVNVDPANEDGLDNLAPTVMVCQVIDIFAAVAGAAGPDLTTESFGAAAESFGPIDVTGVIEGSLGPGKFDITDTPPSIAKFDPDTVEFVTE